MKTLNSHQQKAFQLGQAANDRLEIREPGLDMDWLALLENKAPIVAMRLKDAWLAGYDSKGYPW